jgi:uncharacterized protein
VRLIARLRPLARGLGGEPAWVICGATAFLVVSHYQGSTSWFSSTFGAAVAKNPAREVLPYFWWFGASVVLYGIGPLLLATVTRGRFTRSYGLGLGDARAGLAWAALLLGFMLPAAWIASRTPFFKGAYPLAGSSAFTMRPPGAAEHTSWKLFAAYEAAYVGYFVAWEFLFRGWMLNGLLRRFGRGAILVQTIPFALMHLGKPELEAFGSIVAGVALGILALRTRSIWYGVLVHGGVAVFMDVISR